jgi:hypothetical protein
MARIGDAVTAWGRPDPPELHHLEVVNGDGRGFNTIIRLDGRELRAKRLVISIQPSDWVSVTMDLSARVTFDGQAQVAVKSDVLVLPREETP